MLQQLQAEEPVRVTLMLEASWGDVLAVLTVVGCAGIPVYLAGWLLIPDEGAGQSIASDLIQSLSARSR